MDTLTARAAANALWSRLKRWSWTPAKATRDLADYGDRPSITTTAATITHVARSLDQEVIYSRPYIEATLYPSEWPGGLSLMIHLDQADAEAAIPPADPSATIDQLKACHCRTPFLIAKNRHGSPKYRRNIEDPFLTPELAETIERIARAANITEVDEHTVESALITEDDISLDQVEAILSRT